MDHADVTQLPPGRLMRVKVLYTFDNQNKTNCLARFPESLEVPTIRVDETTQIGIIELKKCIQAIVAASPEIVAMLGQDYTVYAYDYSEYETPLVGQGMLSRVLASMSSTPDAPAHQSKTMITGRVCKNLLALYTGGREDTLEVKLRLVPVPTDLQGEYLANMDRYRQSTMPHGKELWDSLLQRNQDTMEQQQPGQQLNHPFPAQGESYAASVVSYSAHPSRPASPAMSIQSSAALQMITQGPISRPSSRGSTVQPQLRSRHGSFDLSNMQGDENAEEGPARKRARLNRAEWHGRAPFGGKADSLRASATTAASVRVHRPTPILPKPVPGVVPTDALPRAPTPRPMSRSQSATQLQPRNNSVGNSNLRRMSSLGVASDYASPYSPMSIQSQFPETFGESPEDDRNPSGAVTPIDFFPSSPPMARDNSLAPSSPSLPSPDFVDSGFMSGAAQEQESPQKKSKAKQKDGPRHSKSVPPPAGTFVFEELPGPPELLPQKILLNAQAQRRSSNTPAREIRPKSAINRQPSSNEALQGPNHTIEKSTLPPPTDRSKLETNNIDPLLLPPQSEDLPYGLHFLQSTEHTSQSPPILDHPFEPQVADGYSTQTASAFLPDSQDCEVQGAGFSLSLPPRSVSVASDLPVDDASLTDVMKQAPQTSPADARITDKDAYVDRPTPLPVDDPNSNFSKPRSGTGGNRKKRILDKLQDAIAKGEVPPFCKNCGCIETATWRVAFAKTQRGSLKDLSTSDEESGFIAVEVLKKKDDDATAAAEDDEDVTYRILKRTLTKAETRENSWERLQLCNSCGLHLNKWKAMRPPEKWANARRGPPKTAPPGPRRRSRKKPQRTDSSTMMPTSDIYQEPPSMLHTDSLMSEWDPMVLEDQIDPALVQEPLKEDSQPVVEPIEAPRVLKRQRASSVQAAAKRPRLEGNAAAAALERAIQSSPARFIGTEADPIALDDMTPRPTRRLLFPSPRANGEMKTLDNKSIGMGKKDGPGAKEGFTGPDPFVGGTNISIFEFRDENNKENCPPSAAGDDDLASLFDANDTPGRFATPSKIKTPSKRSILDPFKSPTPRSRRAPLTPRQSSALRTTPRRSPRLNPPTSSPAVPLTPLTAFLRSTVSDPNNMTSPSRVMDLNSFLDIGTGTPGRGQLPELGSLIFSDASEAVMPSSPPNFTFTSDFADFDFSSLSNDAFDGVWNATSSAFATPVKGKSELDVLKQEAGQQSSPGMSALIEGFVGVENAGQAAV